MHLAFSLLCMSAMLGTDASPLEKIERRILKEPKYASQPLFGLAVFGPAAKSRIWMVLDKSASDKPYDVLFADLNGNGDLTEPAERIAGQLSAGSVTFRLADFTDASSGATHTEFKLTVSDRSGATHLLSMRWRGERKLGGGYPEDPARGYMRFAPSVKDAPILWCNGDGPFRFQRWFSGEFTIGGGDDLKVFLGVPGMGKNSFCAFQEHVLPVDEPVRATLLYENTAGAKREETIELKGRC